jgi:hypothetical protein
MSYIQQYHSRGGWGNSKSGMRCMQVSGAGAYIGFMHASAVPTLTAKVHVADAEARMMTCVYVNKHVCIRKCVYAANHTICGQGK